MIWLKVVPNAMERVVAAGGCACVCGLCREQCNSVAVRIFFVLYFVWFFVQFKLLPNASLIAYLSFPHYFCLGYYTGYPRCIVQMHSRVGVSHLTGSIKKFSERRDNCKQDERSASFTCNIIITYIQLTTLQASVGVNEQS
jgi:hypothetical protein